MPVTSLTTYPVKSCGGVRADRVEVTPQGLADDRRWLVLDPDGAPVTARECHQLLGIAAEVIDDGVRLRARDGAARDVVRPDGRARLTTTLSRVDHLAQADDVASQWLSDRLGRPVRLAYQDVARSIGAHHGGLPGETMSLADAGPVLLVSEASVRRLREWVAQESGQDWVALDEAVARFRPNIVIDGGEPFVEDDWSRVRIGQVDYRRGELCDRCVMTTIDHATLTTGREPLRTLARHRRWDGATWFGVRLVPELPAGGTATQSVGDVVDPLD